MQEIDRQILSLLAEDGRMSYTDIGKRTGLSTSAAQQRVRRLERRGVISGYRAVVAPSAIGRGITAFVNAEPLDTIGQLGDPSALIGIDGIVSCWTTAGAHSFLLKVQVATTEDLQQLLNRIRTDAVMSTHTMLVLSTPFEDRPAWEPVALDDIDPRTMPPGSPRRTRVPLGDRGAEQITDEQSTDDQLGAGA